jgi:hypothetical protein
MESFNTRLTPKKEYPEPKADQDLTGVLKDILISPSISRNKDKYQVDHRETSKEYFAFRLYSEVIEYLINNGYTSRELKEEPEHLTYEVIDCLNEVVKEGQEINTTHFEVSTMNNWKTIQDVMEVLEMVIGD